MKHYLPTIAALTVSLMGSALIPTLKADQWDKKTKIKIDESIDVQGTVLPPGSYVLKLLRSAPDLRTVQIFNGDENHLIMTVLSSPEYRLTPMARSQFEFYEVAAGQPHALRAWFYPGENAGCGFRLVRGDATVQSGRQPANVTTSTAGQD
ncbi:MAG: hypothetical protein ABSH09_12390 [Bryobacteraceae bacterium]|jgi:hypothetical protein